MVRQGVLIRAALGLSACALTALLYLPFVDRPFVLDDRATVLLNPSLVDLTDARGILAYDRWHPLVNVSFAADRAFSGLSPLGFHITNAGLHVVVVALLFLLAWRQGQTRVKLGSDQGQTTFALSSGAGWAAFLAAAAFGMNPITVRSVAYVSARADLLFAAGVLLAAMLTWGAARSRAPGRLVLAALVAAAALTATPWGFAAPHGPPRFYLTTAAILLAAPWWARPVLARSRAARVAGVLAVAALALVARPALTRWTDPVGLWRTEIARTPAAWDTHLGYADALREASHCGDAVPEYEAVLRMNPGQRDARRGLAACGR